MEPNGALVLNMLNIGALCRAKDWRTLGTALTAKQTRFVAEYLVDLNATQAAIRAGYSRKSAEQQAYET